MNICSIRISRYFQKSHPKVDGKQLPQRDWAIYLCIDPRNIQRSGPRLEYLFWIFPQLIKLNQAHHLIWVWSPDHLVFSSIWIPRHHSIWINQPPYLILSHLGKKPPNQPGKSAPGIPQLRSSSYDPGLRISFSPTTIHDSDHCIFCFCFYRKHDFFPIFNRLTFSPE